GCGWRSTWCPRNLVQLRHDDIRTGSHGTVLPWGERGLPGGVLAGRAPGRRDGEPAPGVRARRGGGGGRGVPAPARRGRGRGGVRGRRSRGGAGPGGADPVAGRRWERVPRGWAARPGGRKAPGSLAGAAAGGVLLAVRGGGVGPDRAPDPDGAGGPGQAADGRGAGRR